MSPKYVPVFKFELFSPDKIVHAGLFGFLCFLFVWGLLKNNLFTHKNVLLLVAFCILYGALIELLQMLGRNGRHADFDDIVANSIGVVLAYLFYIVFYRSLINKTVK